MARLGTEGGATAVAVRDAEGARPGAPAMVVTRTARDREGRAVEFARDIYRGDRARFELALQA